MPLALNARETRWIDHVRDRIVSRLPGRAEQRARSAAIVTWWALKEGILDLPNPLRHNLCNTAEGDRPMGDLDVCPGQVWQVGIAGIQPNNVSLAQVEGTSRRIYPGVDPSEVARRTANEAGVPNGTASAIARGPADLRKAWLLRDGPIAFTLQRPFVEQGCLGARPAGWCFGSWDTARRFASSPQVIQNTIAELEQRFATSESIIGPVLIASAVGLAAWDWTRKGSILRRYLD